MDGLKESKQAVGAATLAAVNNLAPPTILAQASRLNFSTRLFNLLVTNIPGPQLPLYVLGRELQDLFPLAFLPEDHALAIAIMSYNGGLDYGLLGDYDAMPDIDLVADGIEAALAELLAAARAASGARPRPATGRALAGPASTARRAPPTDVARRRRRRPAPIVPADHGRRQARPGRRHARQAQSAAPDPPASAPRDEPPWTTTTSSSPARSPFTSISPPPS